MVRWNWWDWSLFLEHLLPSVLRHCWLGHLTRKTHPDMTYNVFCGTLNPAQSINHSTMVWCSYYTPTFIGLTCLSAWSTNCVWSCADAGRHCSTVSGGTLVTSLWDRITTASSFGYQPSTDSAAKSADHIWRSAFAVAGPSTWNSLRKRLRDPSSSSAVFACLLKTFLFSKY